MRILKTALSAALPLALVLSVLAASCATGSGSAYDRSVSGEMSAVERAAAAKAEEEDDDDPSPGSGWDGSWDDDGSSSPSWGTEPAAGSLSVTLSAPRLTGTLAVLDTPPGSDLYVDGMLRTRTGPDGRASLVVDAGLRVVEIDAFGWIPRQLSVWVPADGLMELYMSLEPAEFSLEPHGASAARFDPDRPGRMGSVRATFRATAPGHARARVTDGQGSVVRDLGVVAIDRMYIDVRWDGSTDAGGVAREGTYLVTLEGEDGTSASLELGLARLRAIRLSSLHGGFSGLILAPDARVMPEGAYLEASAGGYAFVDADSGSMGARVPTWFGERISLGDSLEFAFRAMIVPYLGYDTSPSMSHFSLAGSFKLAILDGPGFALAAMGRFALDSYLDEAVSGWPSPWDGGAGYHGAGAGLVAEFGAERARAFASLELAASDYYPGWDDSRWAVPGFFAWAYLRAGLDYSIPMGALGSLSLGASAAARTEPVGTPFGIREPLSVAGELYRNLPELPLALGIHAAGEWRAFQSWYFAGGLGISVFL